MDVWLWALGIVDRGFDAAKDWFAELIMAVGGNYIMTTFKALFIIALAVQLLLMPLRGGFALGSGVVNREIGSGSSDPARARISRKKNNQSALPPGGDD